MNLFQGLSLYLHKGCITIDYKLMTSFRSPECAKIKQKMVYTSSKDALKRALVGIGRDMQACDHGDLAWTNVLEALMRSEVAH